MKNSKTPCNDGLTKVFYESFWDELKSLLTKSNNQASHTKILSISQRQAVVKPFEKKDRDKRYIKKKGIKGIKKCDTRLKWVK